MCYKYFINNKLLAILGIVILIIVLIPYELVVVPEWQIKVIDSKGNSLPNRKVTQIWTHLSLESANIHREVQETNSEGIVVFPERTVKVSLMKRSFAKFGDLLRFFNPHASSGPHSYVFSERSENGSSYERKGALETILIEQD